VTPFLLHHLLQASAARVPGRAAVVSGARVLTFAELDEQSSRLAHLLLRHGVAAGERVAIQLERSLEAVVAVFGVLKCGAAYVPVDPGAPPARAALLLEDCGVAALVGTRERLARLRAETSARPPCAIAVDAASGGDVLGWSELSGAPSRTPPDPGAIEQDLAYILYTSGSTGRPKGVMLSHRAALSFVHWAVDCFGLKQDDRLANHAPLHFDLSVLDLFGAAAAGAAVLPVPAATGLFPRNLADWIEASAISVWYSVPSALIQLALRGGLERHRYARLRAVLFAGEVFPQPHLRRLAQLLPHPDYFNLYGPTETNVCTVHAVTAEDLASDEPLPIGRACANTEVFALDEQGRPVAPGEPGELCVRGPTLMRGYWGLPELTQAALVPDPRRPHDPALVYRTGDRVRLDASGRYRFLGRRDAQLKSRGYRIEPGDIEAVLHRHPGIAEAVVVPVPHEEFGCTLRAVLAPRPGAAPDRAALAAFCAQHLPAYMIPAEFEFREALPRTSSGKVDRVALHEQARAESDSDSGRMLRSDASPRR